MDLPHIADKDPGYLAGFESGFSDGSDEIG